MNIWEDVEHEEWAELAKRTEPFVEKLTSREDLVVIVRPDTRTESEQKNAPIPGGVFYPRFARINLNPNLLLETYLSDVQFVDPNSIYSQRAFPKYIGVVIHESAHAKHTTYTIPAGLNSNVIGWIKSLEESRCESKMLEAFPQYTQYIKTIVREIVSKDFLYTPEAAAAANPSLREEYNVANQAILVMAREDIGVFEPGELHLAEAFCRKILGEKKYSALRAIWLEAQALEDNDISRLVELAEEIQKLIDPKNELLPPLQANQEVDSPCGAFGIGEDSNFADDATPQPKATQSNQNVDIIRQEVAKSSQVAEKEIKNQGNTPVPPRQNIQQENQERRETIQKSAKQVHQPPRGSGGTYNLSMQVVAPDAVDIGRARAITEAIKKAQFRDVSKTFISSELPPGRLIIREAMNREAQIASRQPLTATPWRQTRRREVDNPPITLAVASDVSGSMSVYQREVSSFTWAVSLAVKRLMGTAGAVAWNGTSHELFKPNQVQVDKLPYYSAAGGSDGCPDAIRALDGMLNLSFGEGVRVLAIITDGSLPNNADIQREISLLAAKGVIVVWVLTYAGGFKPKDATIAVLKQPSDFGTIVGQKIIEALSKA